MDNKTYINLLKIFSLTSELVDLVGQSSLPYSVKLHFIWSLAVVQSEMKDFLNNKKEM